MLNDDCLLMYLSYLSSVSSKILVLGDFNAPNIDWLSQATSGMDQSFAFKLVQTLQDSFLHQHVVDPTRLRSNSTPHVLDLVIMKSPDDILDLKMLPPLGKSNHVVMSLSVNVSAAVNCGSKFYYDYSKGCYNEI